VIAILAILASLLLPALAHGKGAARATECRNNLRTLGLGIRMYVNDFSFYPGTGGSAILSRGPDYGWLVLDDWKGLLIPFIGLQTGNSFNDATTMRTLRCPQTVSNEDGRRGEGQYAYNASGTATLSHAANLGLGGGVDGKYQHTAESRVLSPAELVAVGDIAPGASFQDTFITSGHFDVCSTNQVMWPGSSHRGAANMVFADGHVESARSANWVAASGSARGRWNNDREPHPETWERR